MSTTNQISFPGKTEYTAGDDPTGMITYDLNPDTSGGMPITADVYQQGVVAYITSDKKDPLREKIAFTFSKQLLLFLLSFDECTGLTFCKYQRPEGDESLAAVAVDENNIVLGWNKKTKNFNTGGGAFVGAEWIRSTSLAAAKKCIKPVAEGGGLDFEQFSKSL